MKYAAIAAALLAAPVFAASSVQPTATTTIMTTQYSTYVYTVYDTTIVPTSTPCANSTVVAPTGGSNYTVSVSQPTTLAATTAGSGPAATSPIAPVPKSGAAGLAANWLASAAAAGFAVAALL